MINSETLQHLEKKNSEIYCYGYVLLLKIYPLAQKALTFILIPDY